MTKHERTKQEIYKALTQNECCEFTDDYYFPVVYYLHLDENGKIKTSNLSPNDSCITVPMTRPEDWEELGMYDWETPDFIEFDDVLETMTAEYLQDEGY